MDNKWDVLYWHESDIPAIKKRKGLYDYGEWQLEPDYVSFFDDATGYSCLILRNEMTGTLNGYLGIPEGHPWYQQGYGVIPAAVHGYVTYAATNFGHDRCILEKSIQDSDPFVGPMLLAYDQNGELHYPENLWVIGFDTCHMGDLLPVSKPYGAINTRELKIYKNIEFVQKELQKLAAQALDALLKS